MQFFNRLKTLPQRSCVVVHGAWRSWRHNVSKNGITVKMYFTWFDPNELKDVNCLLTRAGISQVTNTNSVSLNKQHCLLWPKKSTTNLQNCSLRWCHLNLGGFGIILSVFGIRMKICLSTGSRFGVVTKAKCISPNSPRIYLVSYIRTELTWCSWTSYSINTMF